MASETTVWWTDCAMTERWGGGEGVRPDTQPDSQEHFCLRHSSACPCASADPHRTTIVSLLFAWTVGTVTLSALQPCWWRDKWSEVKDGHHITFTPPLFSQHVLLNLPSEATSTQVTAPLWVLARAPSGRWASGTCNRRCSFWRSSIRGPKRSGFAEGRGAPFVCPATAAFPHLSVSDSALWVNGGLIPGVGSLIHRLLSLRCHSLATEPWFSAWKLKWEEKGFSSSCDDWSEVGVGGAVYI